MTDRAAGTMERLNLPDAPPSPEVGTTEIEGISSEMWEQLRQEIVGGLLYCHHRANANTSRALEAASFCYALIELLKEKGIINEVELNDRKKIVGKRLMDRYLKKGMGAVLLDVDDDKYEYSREVQIECAPRVEICQAACCKFRFPLSKQDIAEGIIKWDLAFPYWACQDEQGYCRHLTRSDWSCTIWDCRPIPCRAFDCRKDKRIWLDFEKKIINPELPDLFEKGEQTHEVPVK